MTLLHCELTGFVDYSAHAAPSDVIAVVNRLFTKFEQICDQYGVYKLTTIGDTFIVMGYTGRVSKEKRDLEVAIKEGHNVLQVGMSMLEIVQEEKQKLTSPYLRNFNIKVGIHTGNILGGIIGSKNVRYDIFG